jgi:hypothetical protein
VGHTTAIDATDGALAAMFDATNVERQSGSTRVMLA